jgi:hypothetical protein
VPALATSAYQPEALTELHDLLVREVAARQAALRRLAGDAANVADRLAGLAGPPVAEDIVDRGSVRTLAGALASAAGVPAMVAAAERAYRHRAAETMGWPPARLLRRLRRTPAERTAEDGWSAQDGLPTARVTAAESAHTSAVGMAVRGLAERAGQQLPEAWSSAVTKAARSRVAELPDALDRAVGRTEPNLLGNPPWWWVAAAVQWLATLAGLFGLLWLVAGTALSAALSTLDYPEVGGLPLPVALLIGGLAGGLLVSLALQPVVRFAARRAGARADRQLRFAVAEVGREYVVAPVRDVLHRYAEAREALAVARGSAPAHER